MNQKMVKYGELCKIPKLINKESNKEVRRSIFITADQKYIPKNSNSNHESKNFNRKNFKTTNPL